MDLEKDGEMMAETLINGQMMAEQDDATYAAETVIVPLLVVALTHSDEATVVATNCSRGWKGLQDRSWTG